MGRVEVKYREDRDRFVLHWRDESGKRKTKTTASVSQAEAWLEAAELERQLANPSAQWDSYVARYLVDKGGEWVEQSGKKFLWAISLLRPKPEKLEDVTRASLTQLCTEQRKKGRRPATIRGYIKRIRAFLNYCKDVYEVITHVPRVTLPRLQQKSRGRAITGEEFDRMVSAMRVRRNATCEHYGNPDDAAAWVNLLLGLYWGGLRIEEALSLRWEFEAKFAALVHNDPPVFKMSADQKNRKSQLVPMAPEFRDLCLDIGVKKKGVVFDSLPSNIQYVGKYISKVGRDARILVNDEGKCATAHDLRRAFGTRWAGRLKPAELMQLMRHENIQTTMDYYVDLDLRELSMKLDSATKVATKANSTEVTNFQRSLSRTDLG